MEDTTDQTVFLKETVNPPVQDIVVHDRRFLSEARHAFLIRRPEEIAASWFALEHDMRILDTGLALLYDLFAAVRDAGGQAPIVIDSHDLVTNPATTMAAYCAAADLPFIPEALHWQPGPRPEWARSSRWHEDTANSSGFQAPPGRTTTDWWRIPTSNGSPNATPATTTSCAVIGSRSRRPPEASAVRR